MKKLIVDRDIQELFFIWALGFLTVVIIYNNSFGLSWLLIIFSTQVLLNTYAYTVNVQRGFYDEIIRRKEETNA